MGLLQYATESLAQIQTIKFSKTDGTLVNSTDLPNNYIITIDITKLIQYFTNYNFTLSPPTANYILTIPKGYLTIIPITPTGTYKYGDKPHIRDLYRITGFLQSGENESTLCSGTPYIYITPEMYYGFGFRNYYTEGSIVLPAITHKISVINNNMTVNNTSNYSFFVENNNIPGTIIINKIALSDASINFRWSSYMPSIAYGIPLSNYQLNAISPLNPYTRTPIGVITYIGKNIETNIYDTNNFEIGKTPNVGIYTLTATLTVTDTNYVSTSVSLVNNKYNIKILKEYPSIRHWNPKPIVKGELLTNTELSAISNTSSDPNQITYCKTNGDVLNIGDVVPDDIEIISKINDYTNPNFYNLYTFTKMKLFTE